MIAALLLHFGIPKWMAAVVAAGALAAGLYVGIAWHDHKVFQEGVAHRQAIDAEAGRRAEVELARLNRQVADARVQLATALATVQAKQEEVDHAKAVSAQRQAELLDGRRRLSVLVHVAAAQAAAAGSGGGAGPATVDPAGGAVAATLDGRVASDLEWARQTRNDALEGLAGCVKAYDAVRHAEEAAHGTVDR